MAVTRARIRTHWIKPATLGFLALAFTAPNANAALSPTPDQTLVTDGPVISFARTADKIYLGGNFTRIAPRSGPWVAASAADGTTDTAMPQVSGGPSKVFTTISDGAGGFFIGGQFTHVGGLPRLNVAHILADKTVDPDWAPEVSGEVDTLALSGSTVYIGGSFSGANSVNGSLTRNRLAAVDVATGVATNWDPNVSGQVWSLAVSGSTVYVAGDFNGANAVNGNLVRNRLAAFDATTGTATAWDPNVGATTVRTLLISGSAVYFAGNFTTVNGATPRNRAAAVDATTGVATPWDPNVAGEVRAMALSGSTVYLGGQFTGATSINGTTARTGLAAVDATTGVVTGWNPNPDNSVVALAVSGSTVYAGGGFTSIGGASRRLVAAIDASSGLATSWDLGAGDSVLTLAVSGSTVAVGGFFNFVGDGQVRDHLAELDASDGSLTSWAPDPNGAVLAMKIAGSTLYVGGQFAGAGSFGGANRNRVAAVDLATHTVTAWNPDANQDVDTIDVSGSTVYLGGNFFGANSINNAVARNGAAAVDATTGSALPWNPNLNNQVLALQVVGSTVYLGGHFTGTNAVNGALTRRRLAAVDATSGDATPWAPNLNGPVYTMQVVGSSAYIGGGFDHMGAAVRNHVAAVDTTSGTPTAWDPNANAEVDSLAVDGSIVYIGGLFNGTNALNGSLQRDRLAAVDATTGAATSWAPDANGPVGVVASDGGGGLFVGGNFTSLALAPQANFAHFSAPPSNDSVPVVTGTAQVGQVLACSLGSWSGTMPQSYSREWLRDGALIGGASGADYTAVQADSGHAVSCRVSASNMGGSASATSAPVAVSDAPASDGGGGQAGGGGPTTPPTPTTTTTGDGGATGTQTATGSPGVRPSGSPAAKAQGSSFVVGTGLIGSCPAGGPGCSFTVTATSVVPAALAARTKRIVVGKVTFRLAAGATRKIVVKLNARGARALRKLHRLRVRLKIVTRAGQGAATTVTRTITIKAPRRH